MIYPENCNYITSVKYIGSKGKTISLILLVFGIHILHKWCQHNNLDGNIIIGTTETSYVNDDTTLG